MQVTIQLLVNVTVEHEEGSNPDEEVGEALRETIQYALNENPQVEMAEGDLPILESSVIVTHTLPTAYDYS
jgi:hypothetical protein